MSPLERTPLLKDTAAETLNPPAMVGFRPDDEDSTVTDAAPTSSMMPLFVDLDGSLIASDALVESLFAGLGRGILLAVLRRAAAGRAAIKAAAAEVGAPDPSLLPYRAEVLAFLREEHGRGRPLVLATAATAAVAHRIADHLGLFTEVLASDPRTNLKGRTKLAAIRELCVARGWTRFAYLGDSRADIPVWREADEAYSVAPGRRVRTVLQRSGKLVRSFSRSAVRPAALLAAVRPHHWLKNGLLLLPVLLAHRITELPLLAEAARAVVAFSLAASAVYVLNDLVDIDADRRHPVKRRRPFAAATLPLASGPFLAVALLAAAFALSWFSLPRAFTAVLALYLGATTAYSLALKRIPILDVITLAGLYALRIFAGSAATSVPVSEWLMVFSIFIFTSLALCKRYSELARLAGGTGERAHGRGYTVSDVSLVASAGQTTGLLAVLVLALYLSSPQVQVLYRRADFLWALIPLAMYWVLRLWLLARRGVVLEDPLLFAVTDRASLAVCAVAGLVMLAAA